MVTVNAQIVGLNIIPKGDGDTPPAQEMTALNIEFQNPHSGSCNVVLPSGAMGGIAVGPCRVMVESA